MTGLYGNYDNNRNDDWESISPSTVWWVRGTPNSAFKNPDYRLSWGNRITKPALKGGLPLAVLSEAVASTGDIFKNTDWTMEDEKKALVEVDKYTAKMRKRAPSTRVIGFEAADSAAQWGLSLPLKYADLVAATPEEISATAVTTCDSYLIAQAAATAEPFSCCDCGRRRAGP